MAENDIEKHVTSLAHELVHWLSAGENMGENERRRVSQLIGELATPHHIITICQVLVDSQSQTSHLTMSLVRLAKICLEQDQIPDGMFPSLVETFVDKGLSGYDQHMVEALLMKTRPIGDMLTEKQAPGTSRLVDADGNRL